uniref:Uncharacterized protein n=1 Tax=Arundo donax TaxID=35708 RepID=A0A0A9AY25_ARUDO
MQHEMLTPCTLHLL